MCGIIGYIGNLDTIPVLLDGLKKMEYRGYDSAGIAYFRSKNELCVLKTEGKIKDLENLIYSQPNTNGGSIKLGIGHTRWATHGVPNTVNAHPHTDESGDIVVVHNGIIENFLKHKKALLDKGYKFKSNTDTEVIAHLIRSNLTDTLESAVLKTLPMLEGTYGLAILYKNEPDKIIIARKGSPLIIGKGKDEYLVASDVAALVRYTSDVIYLEDEEIAIITQNNHLIKNLNKETIHRKIDTVDWTIEDTDKCGFPHYMLKEIHEQPNSMRNAIAGRINLAEGTSVLGGLKSFEDRIRAANRIIITAMGTSYHAGLLGEYYIENFAKIPVEVEYSAEFRYRGPILDNSTLVIAISQSGETADTLAAIKEAKLKGSTVASICNVVGSTIARSSHCGVYMHCGPEIGVASTKCFTSQLAILAMIGLFIGRTKALSVHDGQKIALAFSSVPDILDDFIPSINVYDIAKKYSKYRNFLFLGRGYNYPVALEGALKMKEISYIHAEGYNAAEMKHGPIALIDENMPIIFIAPQDDLYEKTISNIREVKARKGKIIAIASEGDTLISQLVDDTIYIPNVESFISPFFSIIPLQLLAYHIAILNGCNVDQPRNLAKSVTVE